MTSRQLRTLGAMIILLSLYYLPFWGIIRAGSVTDWRVIAAGHAVIAGVLCSQYFSGVRRSKAAVDALLIDGVVDSVIERLLGTHPPMDDRIDRLIADHPPS